MVDGEVKLVVGIFASVVAALLLLTVTQTGFVPQPGDPVYPAWETIIDTMAITLPLAVGGVGAITAYALFRKRGFYPTIVR